ncbi:MAG: hypothetical protein QXD60_02820 [Nanopusillaceae archaeon]
MDVAVKAGIYASDLHGIFHISSSSSPTSRLISDFRAEFLGAGTVALASISRIVLLRPTGTGLATITVTPSQWTVSAGTAWMSALLTLATLATVSSVRVLAGTRTYFTANLLATLQPGTYALSVTLSVLMQWALTLNIELYSYGVMVSDVALRSEILRRITGQRTSALYIATAVALYGSTATVVRTSTGYYANLAVYGVNQVVIYLHDTAVRLATLTSDYLGYAYTGDIYLTVRVVA